MILIFEGLPGSGKTSIIQKLTEVYRERIVVAPEIMPDAAGDPNEFTFYVANDIRKAEFLATADEGKVYLADRYWHSTVLYTCAANHTLDLTSFNETYRQIYQTDLFAKYLYIFLDINSEDSRQKALTHEITSNWQDAGFVQRAHYLYHLIYRELEEINSDLRGKMLLDMNQLSIEQGCAEVVKFINRWDANVST